jgi:hypothetical protein
MIGPWSEAGSVCGTMHRSVTSLIVIASSLQEALADAGCKGVADAWMEEI